MNKLYSTLMMVAIAANLFAQITVTNANFPAAGDTLFYATDLSPDGVTITPPGGANWDFTGLNADFQSTIVFKPASEGSAAPSFPTASLVRIGTGGQSETYYAASANKFEKLGYHGNDPTVAGLPIQTTFPYSPPLTERRAPMKFFDINQLSSSINIAFSVPDLGPLADSLPIAAFADSVRIRGIINRLDVVDAFGSLAIPGGTYNVLREKRTEYRDTRLDVHTFLGWQDITNLVLGAGGGIADGFGTDTVISYLFMSDTEKEIIAEVNTSADGLVPRSVRFKDNDILNALGDATDSTPQVLISPNPASGQVVFSMKNLAPGNYSLRLVDVRGRAVLRSKLNNAENTVRFDNMSGGTYFYQVFDENNRAVGSGKLLIISQ